MGWVVDECRLSCLKRDAGGWRQSDASREPWVGWRMPTRRCKAIVMTLLCCFTPGAGRMSRPTTLKFTPVDSRTARPPMSRWFGRRTCFETRRGLALDTASLITLRSKTRRGVEFLVCQPTSMPPRAVQYQPGRYLIVSPETSFTVDIYLQGSRTARELLT